MKPEQETKDEVLEEEEEQRRRQPSNDKFIVLSRPWVSDFVYNKGGDLHHYIMTYDPGNFAKPSRSKPSKRKPTKKTNPQEIQTAPGRKKRPGRLDTSDLNPVAAGGVSAMKLIQGSGKPSRRAKPSRAESARARLRSRAKMPNRQALEWMKMDQYEREDYIASLHRQPYSEVEPILNKLPVECSDAYWQGPKRDDGAETFYDEEWRPDDYKAPDDDTWDDEPANVTQDSNPDDDEEYVEEEAETYTNEWRAATEARDEDGEDEYVEESHDSPHEAYSDTSGYDDEADQDGDHDTEETVNDVYDDEQEQAADDGYQESDFQDSDDDESESSDVETDESESYVEPGYSAYDDYQSFHEASWGEVDSEGTDHADMVDHADVDVADSDLDSDADGDADSGTGSDAEYEMDMGIDGTDMDMDVDYGEYDYGDYGDWGDFQ